MSLAAEDESFTGASEAQHADSLTSTQIAISLRVGEVSATLQEVARVSLTSLDAALAIRPNDGLDVSMRVGTLRAFDFSNGHPLAKGVVMRKGGGDEGDKGNSGRDGRNREVGVDR